MINKQQTLKNMYRLSSYGYKNIFSTTFTKDICILSKCYQNILYSRYYSNRRHHKNAKQIRKEFIEYFTNDLNHTFIPSSPVIPWCDPSVSFINAGMNQFKGIFLGEHDPPVLKAVNYQKCIRVGGKHNDLSEVGLDSYHHTFFEMLGNWSFGAYGKEEACKYAWEMLTDLFKVDSNHLYVTYFGGDESLNLKADLECRDIWLKLGVPDNRIFPTGIKDNFWEMNIVGPCGPCTEIHIDKSLQTIDKNSNKRMDLTHLTELWNIVFIEYQRLANGSIVPLDKQFIDTGMGFERLVAVLQGKKSNYDTDLFQPLFRVIHKNTNVPEYNGKFGSEDENKIDTGYRILADHGRMITVALADGMIPEKNHKLRRILRKAIIIGNETFKKHNLLHTLIPYIAESLGDTYPEIVTNLKQIQTIVEYESNLLDSLRSSSQDAWKNLIKIKPSLANISDPFAPGLIKAYEELQMTLKNNPNSSVISGELAFKMYDTYGLDIDAIEELAEIEQLSLNKQDFDEHLKNARIRSRIGVEKHRWMSISQECLDQLKLRNVPTTNDSYKYQYSLDGHPYQFPPLVSNIVGLIMNGHFWSETSLKLDNNVLKSAKVGIVLDKTSFYASEGGQLSDKGNILIKNISFDVAGVQKLDGYVIHQLTIDELETKNIDLELCIGDDVNIIIDQVYRTNSMRNHTATHLLHAALKATLPAVAQRGSIVRDTNLEFKFTNFGVKISPEHLQRVEKLINDCIDAKIPVKSKSVDMFQFLAEKDLTRVPGEVYPEKEIRIVEINSDALKSKEACCGTHVHNTSVLHQFSIYDFTSRGTSNQTIKAVTGVNIHSMRAQKMTNTNLNYLANATTQVSRKEIIMSFVRKEMAKAISSRTDPFIVHCLDCNDIKVESVPLQIAIEFCKDLPVFLIVKSRRKVRARCVVPEDYQTANFNAHSWMEIIKNELPIQLGLFDDEDPLHTSHTKVLKLSAEKITLMTEKAVKEAKLFALKHVKNEQKNSSMM